MKIDVAGRVANTALSASKPLLPLYEAVVNSVQAIEDADTKDGRIEITVLRDSQSLLQGDDASLRSVTGFQIRDNGIGFDEANFASFNTSDTKFKAQRGGKGVGRFVWLVAFNEVQVESIYKQGADFRARTFKFIPSGEGIAGLEEAISKESKRCTIVRLLGMRERFQAHCPKRPETIADHIAEHCLEFFIRGNCPKIRLNDPATHTEIDLNRYFELDMLQKSKPTKFDVKGQSFHVTHVRLYAARAKDHQAHFCANDRVVQSRKLTGRLPNLHAPLEDEKGQTFSYAAYVESKLLDESVNAERTGFAIDEDTAALTPEDVSWSDIRRAVDDQSTQYLKQYTESVSESKKRRIKEFVSSQAPMYRPILQYIGDKIDQIDPNLDDDGLDVELYRAYHDLAVSTKAEGTSLLRTEANESETHEEFSNRLESYFEKVTDLNAADLARYVCQRKTVLDFLDKLLGQQPDSKYHLEKHVHDVIFPTGKTSEEIPFDSHNLWLIDEKLAYHAFLASDKTLKSVPLIDGGDNKEPDILVFDHACAFVPASEPPFPAITLIEFKRPMRDDYTESDNPFVQVRSYIEKIRSNKARTPDGREIPIPSSLPFYCYIICDLGEKLETWAHDFELQKTPDGAGFFGFKRPYNAYFEVISYSKLISDARKRNAILFDKLNLPSRVPPMK